MSIVAQPAPGGRPWDSNLTATGKVALILYGSLCYAVSLLSFLYFAGWISNKFFRVTIDSAPRLPPVPALLINALVLGTYCTLHSSLARTRVKQVTRRYVPMAVERSTYCLLFSLLLFGLCFSWQSVPTVVWHLENRTAVAMTYSLFILAWGIHFLGLVLIDHNEFFGIRQIEYAVRGKVYKPAPPVSRRAYIAKHVPVIVGLIMIPWATPTMSVGRLFFAVLTSVYCLAGAYLSDRDTGAIREHALGR